MRYRYAFANSGWCDVSDDPIESTVVLRGAKPMWQDAVEQSRSMNHYAQNYILTPFTRPFSKHPFLTILFNGLVLVSALAITAHIFINFKTLHPFVLLFVMFASGSLSSVLSLAVEEFYGKKEKN